MKSTQSLTTGVIALILTGASGQHCSVIVGCPGNMLPTDAGANESPNTDVQEPQVSQFGGVLKNGGTIAFSAQGEVRVRATPNGRVAEFWRTDNEGNQIKWGTRIDYPDGSLDEEYDKNLDGVIDHRTTRNGRNTIEWKDSDFDGRPEYERTITNVGGTRTYTTTRYTYSTNGTRTETRETSSGFELDFGGDAACPPPPPIAADAGHLAKVVVDESLPDNGTNARGAVSILVGEGHCNLAEYLELEPIIKAMYTRTLVTLGSFREELGYGILSAINTGIVVDCRKDCHSGFASAAEVSPGDWDANWLRIRAAGLASRPVMALSVAHELVHLAGDPGSPPHQGNYAVNILDQVHLCANWIMCDSGDSDRELNLACAACADLPLAEWQSLQICGRRIQWNFEEACTPDTHDWCSWYGPDYREDVIPEECGRAFGWDCAFNQTTKYVAREGVVACAARCPSGFESRYTCDSSGSNLIPPPREDQWRVWPTLFSLDELFESNTCSNRASCHDFFAEIAPLTL